VIRKLWAGEQVTHHGRHYVVEAARLYSRPERPPKISMSCFGPKATDVAARIANGFVSTAPDAELLGRYRAAGGRGVVSAGIKVCWGTDWDACARLVHRLWRTQGVPGQLSQELRTPALFEQAASTVSVEAATAHTPCGPAVEPIVDAVRTCIDAGFDRIYLNQIRPDQEGFFRFYRDELAGALAEIGASADADASLASV
jgi:G6PDH family F420-dependent oxidoreductase